MEKGLTLRSNFHLAGIIPVSGHESKFGFPWPDCMQPISDNYLAIERSIIECAYAGCETIWLVCNDDIQPIIKQRIGDYIEDPYCLSKHSFVKHPSEHRRQIPIFYTPIHPKDRDRRDSYGWSALHGALTAFIISSKISKWLIPSRYYVCFPYGVYDPEQVYKHRKDISSEQGFFISYNGLTVRDGEYLAFTMDAEEYKGYLWNIKNSCSGGSLDLESKKRWSSKHFSLDKIYESAKIEESKVVEAEWYCKIDSWTSYRDYMNSSGSRCLARPSEKLFSYHEYNRLWKEE